MKFHELFFVWKKKDTKNVGTSFHDKDNMAAIVLDHDSRGKVRLVSFVF